MNIPKYVLEILKQGRLAAAPVSEQDEKAHGYTFRLYRLNNAIYDSTMAEEAARICAWARRQYADAYVLRSVFYTVKEHRKPYYKRDYTLVTITDPVALKLEKQIDLLKKPAPRSAGNAGKERSA